MIFSKSSSVQNNGNGEKQLYTCGMHPEIISEEPGNCPICEMKLVPVKKSKQTDGKGKILYWRAPMDPDEIYDKPGKSKMGMDLVPVYESDAAGSGIVTIDPEVQQNMNLSIQTVASRKLSPNILTNGVIVKNEKKDFIVTTRVSGWIEKLYVNSVGQNVRQGEKLLEIYSPELVAAEQELLSAISYKNSLDKIVSGDLKKSGDNLLSDARQKLLLLGLNENEISTIERSGKINTNVVLTAGNSGTVIAKTAVEGQKITAGSPLLHISDLSHLWLLADIYENELPKVSVGSKANIKLNSYPGKNFSGNVSFIYPELDPKTRTAKVRIEIQNPNGLFKPEMFAGVEIIGKELPASPVVPENAVIRSGTRDLVILSLGNGKFMPKPVALGINSDGYYQVLNGLNDGDKIVTSSQFLIDSESNLKAAISQFAGSTAEIPQEVQMDENNSHKGKEMKMNSGDSGKEENGKLKDMPAMENHSGEESITRTGTIDVTKLDKNKDGKLFECPMDWNVIADEAGHCPECGMKLKEYSTDEVKANLLKFGYKIKD